MSKRSDELLPTPQAGDYKNKDYDLNTSNLPARLRGTGRYQRSRGLLQSPMPSDASGGRTTKGKKRQNETGLRRQLLPAPLGISDGTANHGKTNGTWQTSINKTLSYSPPDSPASPSVALDEDAERTMTATSGRRLWQSSPQPGPSGYCLKMLLESSAWYSPTVRLQWQAKPLFSKVRMTKSQTMTPSQEESTETSDKQGMRPFGCLYQLAVSERRTDETGCGLLPTATSDDANNATRVSGQYQSLTREIAMLPTPAARDWKSDLGHMPNDEQYGANGRPLARTVSMTEDGKRTGMKLHSDFVCWMQGYPLDWLDVD